MNKDYGNILLNKLIDKYEKSNAFRTGKPSSRRILIKLYDNGESDFPLYDIEQVERRIEINQKVLELSKQGMFFFEWMKGEENHILAKVWLNMESLPAVYAYLRRTPKEDEIDKVCLQLTNAIENADALWAKNFLCDTYDAISTKRSINNRLPANDDERKKLLGCICLASHPRKEEILERVFSLTCFGDSKRFEKTMRSKLLSILRNYLDTDEDATDEDLLRQVGIAKYPEQFEFCGDVSLIKGHNEVDFSDLQYGTAIFRDELVNGKLLIADHIQHVITIENRANYIDYIYRQKKENELILYHGGQYSASKRKFFEMISLAMPVGADWLHWGDIDYGGFSMLMRLRREIRRDVAAYRMGIDELKQYESLCADFNDEYAKKLEQLLFFDELLDCYDCIRFMLDTRKRLEQEALLTT